MTTVPSEFTTMIPWTPFWLWILFRVSSTSAWKKKVNTSTYLKRCSLFPANVLLWDIWLQERAKKIQIHLLILQVYLWSRWSILHHLTIKSAEAFLKVIIFLPTFEDKPLETRSMFFLPFPMDFMYLSQVHRTVMEHTASMSFYQEDGVKSWLIPGFYLSYCKERCFTPDFLHQEILGWGIIWWLSLPKHISNI